MLWKWLFIFCFLVIIYPICEHIIHNLTNGSANWMYYLGSLAGVYSLYIFAEQIYQSQLFPKTNIVEMFMKYYYLF